MHIGLQEVAKSDGSKSSKETKSSKKSAPDEVVASRKVSSEKPLAEEILEPVKKPEADVEFAVVISLNLGNDWRTSAVCVSYYSFYFCFVVQSSVTFSNKQFLTFALENISALCYYVFSIFCFVLFTYVYIYMQLQF